MALEAVDQLATLTNGLSRNIWQKIMIIESIAAKKSGERQVDAARNPIEGSRDRSKSA